MYHEAQGYKDDGILPGTSWQDIPDDWCCPHCGASKEDFEQVKENIQLCFEIKDDKADKLATTYKRIN